VRKLLLVALAVLHASSGGGRAQQPADGVFPSPAPRDRSRVETALAEGQYPWYDSAAEKVKPVWPSGTGWQKSWAERFDRLATRVGGFIDRIRQAIGRFFGRLWPRRLAVPRQTGEVLMAALLFAGLAALLVLLIRMAVRSRFERAGRALDPSDPGTIARLADLPEEAWRQDSDPWNEALRRRALGDLAGAVVCLFAYQLLSLNRLGLIRLVPGRTGRQYVKSVDDPLLRGSAAATLRLFEESYYGHRTPGTAAFEMVWRQAEAFRAKLLGGLP
jgi:hypothetical protein